MKTELSAKQLLINDIKQQMKDGGISIQELAHAFDGLFMTKKPTFEIIYKDGTRSWNILKGKKPVAFIVKGYAVAVARSVQYFNWQDAQKYCASQSLLGKNCSCGSREFWFEVFLPNLWDFNLQLARFKLPEINPFDILWTDTEIAQGQAAAIAYFLGNRFIEASGKLNAYYARPVAQLV